MTALGRRIEIADNNKLPFLGMMIEKRGCHRTTSVYRKPTDTGLLLHYHSHVDHRQKRSLLNTMLKRAHRTCHQRGNHLQMNASASSGYLQNSSTWRISSNPLSSRTRILRPQAVKKLQLQLQQLIIKCISKCSLSKYSTEKMETAFSTGRKRFLLIDS